MSSDHRFGLSAALTTPFDAGQAIDIPAPSPMPAGAWRTAATASPCSAPPARAPRSAPCERGVRARGLHRRRHSGPAHPRRRDGQQRRGCRRPRRREVLEAGCRGVLLAPPSYYKNVGDDGLFAWFGAVFSALGPAARDVFLYNIPSVTAVELSVDLVGRLRAAFPAAVAGVKDSSGHWAYTERLLAGPSRPRHPDRRRARPRRRRAPGRPGRHLRHGQCLPAAAAAADPRGPRRPGAHRLRRRAGENRGDARGQGYGRAPHRGYGLAQSAGALAPVSDGDMDHLTGLLDRMDRMAAA